MTLLLGEAASNQKNTEELQLAAGECLTEGQLLGMKYRVIGVFDEAMFEPLPPLQCNPGSFNHEDNCKVCA